MANVLQLLPYQVSHSSINFLFTLWSYVSWLIGVVVLDHEAACSRFPNQMTFCGGHQQESLSQNCLLGNSASI